MMYFERFVDFFAQGISNSLFNRTLDITAQTLIWWSDGQTGMYKRNSIPGGRSAPRYRLPMLKGGKPCH